MKDERQRMGDHGCGQQEDVPKCFVSLGQELHIEIFDREGNIRLSMIGVVNGIMNDEYLFEITAGGEMIVISDIEDG